MFTYQVFINQALKLKASPFWKPPSQTLTEVRVIYLKQECRITTFYENGIVKYFA